MPPTWVGLVFLSTCDLVVKVVVFYPKTKDDDAICAACVFGITTGHLIFQGWKNDNNQLGLRVKQSKSSWAVPPFCNAAMFSDGDVQLGKK